MYDTSHKPQTFLFNFNITNMKLFILLASACLTLYTVLSSVQSYKTIINFGDSISDTGNYLLTSAFKNPVIGKLPYGETFFHYPTGRSSDGRITVDFISKYLLSFTSMYEHKKENDAIYFTYIYINKSLTILLLML